MDLSLILIAFGVSFGWMSFLWMVALAIKNFAIVDVGWGVSVFLFALTYFHRTAGIQPKEALLLFVVGLWSFRLSYYLLNDRILGHEEEGRYKKLRDYFKTNIPFKFFLFFQAQALFNVILSIPFFIVAMNPASKVGFVEIIGFSISFFAILGESLSDRQLKIFKRNPANKGRVCDVGLWAYSRHPNYFFEFLVWVGFFVVACNEPMGLLAIVAPASILYTLLKFTGIPSTEAQALRSKGDLYREYQERVSIFVPWPPKPKK